MTTATAATAVIATRGSIKVEPLTCAIGAELANVNLGAASRDAALVAEIRALLVKHKVLFFRDQDITRAEHVAFARHFGELEDHPVAGSDPDNPGLVRIYKSPDSPADRYENAWHTDATWREKPPFGCVLRCVECPPVGGDTMWVNMAEAYNRLPESIKVQISGLRARHSIEATFGAGMPIEKRLALKAQFPDAEHPVVRTHPESGEKVLFVRLRQKRRLVMVEPPSQPFVRAILEIDDRILVAVELIAVESVARTVHRRRVIDLGVSVDFCSVKFGKDRGRRHPVETIAVIKYPEFHI